MYSINISFESVQKSWFLTVHSAHCISLRLRHINQDCLYRDTSACFHLRSKLTNVSRYEGTIRFQNEHLDKTRILSPYNAFAN